MAVEIKFSQSYLWLNSWVLANIIQLATQSFCDRFVNYRIDPCRRLYDQMVLAARSGVANIAEGSSRSSTSLETNMRLIDVARASIDELKGDYFNFLLRRRTEIWPVGNPNRETLWKMNLDTPNYSHSILHDAAIHILQQKSKFDPWLENESADVAANAILILCWKLNKMLQKQLLVLLDQHREKGGFSENMTAERIEARRRQASESNAPACPNCGKPMLRRTQMRGQGQGQQFWGCSDYPKCKGTRPV